jgi:uncharacterized SAM-binding protein YcdF (DUF218 family)
MFFILSKVLLFLLSPFIWVIIVFILGFVFKKPKWKKRSFVCAFLMLLFFSNGFIFDQIIKWWEAEPVMMHELDANYDYAIVLGGMASHDSSMNRIVFHESIDRLLQTLDLYSRGFIDTVIISGGSARLLFKEKKEATVLKNYLVNLGVNSERLLTDPESKNTYENITNSIKLMNEPEKQKVLLVTSAFHMRRVKAVLEKAGIQADTYPAHFISSAGPFNPATIVLPGAGTFVGWDMLIKEIVGLMVYKIKGYA